MVSLQRPDRWGRIAGAALARVLDALAQLIRKQRDGGIHAMHPFFLLLEKLVGFLLGFVAGDEIDEGKPSVKC